MEARDSFCFPKKTKNPNPSPIGKKFGFCCCGAPPGTRTLGPLIKRNQRATIVNSRITQIRYFYRFTVNLRFASAAFFAPVILSCIRYPAVPVCKKCAKVCRAKISPAKQGVPHSPANRISTVFRVQNYPVLSRQQSYMTHRFYGRV